MDVGVRIPRKSPETSLRSGEPPLNEPGHTREIFIYGFLISERREVMTTIYSSQLLAMILRNITSSGLSSN